MITRELTIEGVTFKVGPTPLCKLADARRLFGSGALDTEDGMKALIAAVFWGARRAGSEVTLEWLELNVDVHNAAPVFNVFMDVNALKPKEATPGEAPAATSPTS
jgi:hypothetical protein